MTTTIKFGTDGWRGIIAQDFTFDNVRLCAQSFAEYLQDAALAPRGIIVGYDTRFASEHFAAAVAEVLGANGIKVYLCPQPTPTPVISYSVLLKKTGGAVVITASHNPAMWNGFKVKSEHGASASPEVAADLERRIPHILSRGVKQLPLKQGLKEGIIEYLELMPAYLEHVSRLVDLESLRHAGLKVIVDCMYGTGAGYFPALLCGGNTQVMEIHQERNPLFPGIRPEPIAPYLEKLSTLVREQRANVGLATDGDADRLGVIDERGNFLTQLQVFALLALYLLEVRGERGALIKTITTTSMLYRLGEIFHVPVYETPVGFKYVAPRMMAENALIGGEESGGYGFRGHVPERDGLLAGLYFLDLMVRLNKSPSELLEYLYSKVGPHHYHRLDVEFSPEEREAIRERLSRWRPQTIDRTEVAGVEFNDGLRFMLQDGSWLLLRFSGTEPIIRIYAESDSLERVERMLAEGRRAAGV
jgi:phosphomannomutase